MTLIILAAGFATRLEPRTFKVPKHLLPLKGGQVVMDLFVQSLASVNDKFDRTVLVTNQRYYPKFRAWAKKSGFQTEIISDGVKSKEERIGAIGDLLFAIEKCKIRDDIMICAADYILQNIDFGDFIRFARGRSATITMHEDDKSALKAGSCLKIARDGRIVRFEEKPKKVFSDLYGVPQYFLSRGDIQYVEKIPKNLRDNIGQLVAQLVKKSRIYAYTYTDMIIHLTTEKDYQALLQHSALEKAQN